MGLRKLQNNGYKVDVVVSHIFLLFVGSGFASKKLLKDNKYYYLKPFVWVAKT